MKPKQAKEMTATILVDGKNEIRNPIQDAIEFFPEKGLYWKLLRQFIEAIEEAGYTVSITKDGKEYNR